MAREKQIGTIPMTLIAAAVVAGGYIGFQRIGTTANADTVTYFTNLAGGFVAVGMTERQPGFILLSLPDKMKIPVAAEVYSNAMSGDFTVVSVTASGTAWRKRLRGPEVVLLSTDGIARDVPVDWSLKDFLLIADAMDCSKHTTGKPRSCGAPFDDLSTLLGRWPTDRVPREVREFLTVASEYHAAD
jgi:hypothetical protein